MFTFARRTFSAAAPGATTSPLIGKYTVLPRDLFRIMLGPNIRLRDLATQQSKGRASFDLIVHDGLVVPAQGEAFQGPNGASFRPNTFNFQNTVRSFRAPDFQVVKIPQGTQLPPELVVLHEHSDHWSLQCAKPMKLSELNSQVSRLCQTKGTTYGKEEFLEQFPYNSAVAQ